MAITETETFTLYINNAMSIYASSPLYNYAVEVSNEYSRFFAAIAVANEASKEKSRNLAQSLTKLQETCRSFSDLLLHINRVCNDNINKLNTQRQ